MYKVIDLGHEFESTGEPRVQVLDAAMVKTASSDIQRFWDTLSENDDNAYLWVIGVSACEYYGCNNNGDAFTEQELKNHHNTFVGNAHVFLHHVNKDPNKSIGKPLFSFYNDAMHRVELVIKIDKRSAAAKDTLAKIKRGEQIGVSMGCKVKFDVCSICGNSAKTRKDYCNCAKYNMKAILPDGRQVFVYNPEPQFFDISIVNKPADPTALTLDKIASAERGFVGFSAKTGEDAEYFRQKLAAIDKLSDIIKKIEGTAIDAKGGPDMDVLTPGNLDKIDYPMLSFNDMEYIGGSPDCILKALASLGAPPSIGEVAYVCGKKEFGDELTEDTVSEIFRLIPQALKLFRLSGAPMERHVFPLFEPVVSEADLQAAKEKVSPVANARIIIIKQAADKGELEKFARSILDELPMGNYIAPPPGHAKSVPSKFHAMAELRAQKGPGFYTQYTVRGQDGKLYQTDRRAVAMTEETNALPRFARKVLAAVLGTAAVGAFLAEPNLTRKLMASGALGAGAVSAWNTQKPQYVKTLEGFEVPVNTLFHEKQGSAAQAVRSNIGAVMGMSIPAALGLDYAYNRHIRNRNNPHYEHFMTPGKRRAHDAGQTVAEYPVTSILAGGMAGGAAAEGIRRLIPKLRRVR